MTILQLLESLHDSDIIDTLEVSESDEPPTCIVNLVLQNGLAVLVMLVSKDSSFATIVLQNYTIDDAAREDLESVLVPLSRGEFVQERTSSRGTALHVAGLRIDSWVRSKGFDLSGPL